MRLAAALIAFAVSLQAQFALLTGRA